MGSLILLVLLFTAIMIGMRFRAEMQERKLRDNPPERRVIQVSLPSGVATSPKEMTRFIRTVAKTAAAGGAKERRSGARQLDILYHLEVPGPKALPVATFRIYSDPDRMDAIKRSIKQVYAVGCEVNELKEDDLLELAAEFKPQPEAEPEEAEMRAHE